MKKLIVKKNNTSSVLLFLLKKHATFFVIYETLKLQMKNSFVRPMFQFCLIANPIVNTILIYEMFKNSNQTNFATYVILGAGLMGLWSCICFSSAGDINRERFSGTLSLIFATPTTFSTIIFGKILGNTILSLVTLLISLVSAKILYQANIIIVNYSYLILSLFITIICFIAISTVIAYLLTLSRKTTLYMNCIEIPIILICGFVFPIEMLPQWAQYISYLFPPTWAIKLIRMSIDTINNYQLYFNTLIITFFITVIYFVLAKLLYKIIDKHIRIKATLEVS